MDKVMQKVPQLRFVRGSNEGELKLIDGANHIGSIYLMANTINNQMIFIEFLPTQGYDFTNNMEFAKQILVDTYYMHKIDIAI